jgi:hypothetical protein
MLKFEFVTFANLHIQSRDHMSCKNTTGYGCLLSHPPHNANHTKIASFTPFHLVAPQIPNCPSCRAPRHA